MRFLITVLLVLGFAPAALAASLDGITCTAEQWEIIDGKLANEHKVPLKVTNEGGFKFLTAEINGHAYVLNPNYSEDEFIITQSWNEGYTTGAQATLAFGSSKRIQMSFVDFNKVFKLVCLKQ
jgi:hypothetical protein